MKKITKTFKRWHRWLGILSGAVFFYVALTGTLFVFADETIDAVAGDARRVKVEQGGKQLSVDSLMQCFRTTFPDRKPFYADVYRANDRSMRVASSDTEGNDLAYTYLNPYTGKEIKTSRSYHLFFTLAHLHSELVMGEWGEWGKWIVAITTVIFFFELLTGAVLWLPRRWNAKSRTASFLVKRGKTWRTWVYSLHKVLGFYTLIPAFIITLTAIIMFFDVLSRSLRSAVGGVEEPFAEIERYEPPLITDKTPRPIATIVQYAFAKRPQAQQCRVSFWNEHSGAYNIQVAEYVGLISSRNGENMMLNKYTGAEIVLPQAVERAFSVNEWLLRLHIGAWGGLTVKLLMFIIGLILTSLPVTGLLMLLRR